MTQDTNESKTERATLTLTPSEKRDLKFVAEAKGTDEATLLRQMLLGEVVTEARRIRELANAA